MDSYENWDVDGKIPVDLLVSILINLPVKSLLRFKAVCKSWCSLISSSVFIKIHLHVQSNNLLLIRPSYLLDELSFVNHDYKAATFNIKDLTSCHQIYVVDSCNGLVCLHVSGYCKPDNIGGWVKSFEYERHILLWNPATRRYRSIHGAPPKHPYYKSFKIGGLGYVEATDDYKMVGLGIRSTDERSLFVYTLSSDSWKELDYDAKSVPRLSTEPSFINGCIHWLLDKCTCRIGCKCTCTSNLYKIFAFDVAEEVMSSFGVVVGCRSNLPRQTLVIIRGCLSIVISPPPPLMEAGGGGIEIWMMLEYGDEGSWVKQFTIQDIVEIVVPLRSWKDGEIVFVQHNDKPEKAIFYDPCSKKMSFLEDGPFIWQAFNYVESLASVIGGGRFQPPMRIGLH